jgi:cell division protein ZapA
MAEQSISIKIADRTYPLKVTSAEHEEVIRKAAEDINRMISKYQEKYPGKGMIEILSFVALNTCMSNITLNRQIKGLNAEEETLAKELEGYLANIDKNSR